MTDIETRRRWCCPFPSGGSGPGCSSCGPPGDPPLGETDLNLRRGCRLGGGRHRARAGPGETGRRRPGPVEETDPLTGLLNAEGLATPAPGADGARPAPTARRSMRPVPPRRFQAPPGGPGGPGDGPGCSLPSCSVARQRAVDVVARNANAHSSCSSPRPAPRRPGVRGADPRGICRDAPFGDPYTPVTVRVNLGLRRWPGNPTTTRAAGGRAARAGGPGTSSAPGPNAANELSRLSSLRCPRCGATFDPPARFCPKDGFPLVPGQPPRRPRPPAFGCTGLGGAGPSARRAIPVGLSGR